MTTMIPEEYQFLSSSLLLLYIWNEYINHKDSYIIPFIIPLLFWLFSYIYCTYYYNKDTYHSWTNLHNIHNIGGICIGLISLYYNNNNIFSERISILWSLSYFIIDLYDCIARYDIIYSLHALFCLSLGLCNYNSSVFYILRMNSKASLLELSTPMMHIAKKTKNPIHFLLFAIIFTICRIIWIPILYYQCITIGNLLYYDIRLLCLIAFYILNLYWYYKILKILYNGFFIHDDNKYNNNKNDTTTTTTSKKES